MGSLLTLGDVKAAIDDRRSCGRAAKTGACRERGRLCCGWLASRRRPGLRSRAVAALPSRRDAIVGAMRVWNEGRSKQEPGTRKETMRGKAQKKNRGKLRLGAAAF